MNTRIYIDWEEGEVYFSLEEVANSLVFYNHDFSFRAYLDNNYTSEEIYNMTKKEKDEAKQEYSAWVENETKEHIRDAEWTVLEINTELDVKRIQ